MAEALQKKLVRKYRDMFGISKIKISDDGINIFDGSINNLTSLNVLNNCTIGNNLYVTDNLYGINDMHTRDISCVNTFSYNDILTNNLISNDYILITNNTIINQNITCTTDFTSNEITCYNNLETNILTCFTVLTDNIVENTTYINIDSNIITIGKSNSVVNINGTVNNVLTSNVLLSDKLITINDNNAMDTDPYEIIINGISGNGYIKTTDDSEIYNIKAPLESAELVIKTIKTDENVEVSSSSVLYKNVTVFSDLHVLSNSTSNNISTNTLFVNSTCLTNNIVSNNFDIATIETVLQNATINSVTCDNLNTLSNSTVTSDLYVGKNLYSTNANTYNGNILSGTNLLINTTVNSTFQSTECTISNGVNIRNNYTNSNDLTVNIDSSVNDIFVSGNSIVLNNLTTLSDLNTTDELNINGNITCTNLLTNSIIILPLVNYDTNSLAVANGVPEWGLYRTGGIVKIRLDVIPATMELIGSNVINMFQSNDYIEPGVTSVDNDTTVLDVYINSIVDSGSTEYLTENILLETTNQTITLFSTFSVGTYTINYISTDIIGNDANITRVVNVTM